MNFSAPATGASVPIAGARMALAHKGLKAEVVPCRFTDKHLFAFSGGQTVMVLQDEDKAITDSWDIACYLEDN